ncbi:MAG: hypothetical protein LC729_00130 [Acidobacteria bacterium]|nr:hypothetical protein [Acidobacteriota bacterium]
MSRAAVGVRSAGAVPLYVVLVWVVAAVNDGWSGRPFGFVHQLVLLPFAAIWAVGLVLLLRFPQTKRSVFWASGAAGVQVFSLALCGISECAAIAGFFYEARHFARFGYGFDSALFWMAFAVAVLAVLVVALRRTGTAVFGGALACYAAGLLLAVRCFPLNYLRSDMLPVIEWADVRLLNHLNPYETMHVGSRLYDFPYLPGMLIAFLPAVAFHVDVRLLTLACVLGLAALIYSLSSRQRRMDAAILVASFLLSPFLQYRHDLYLAPHWLALVLAVALMQRRHFVLAAVAFGWSMSLYQLSWVIFPFFVLNGLRRGGWKEAVKLSLVTIASMLVVVGPFLASATRRIASNTVGQWSRLPHALADPINLSYWVTYIVRPDQLKWVQLAAMTGVFGFCILRNRCRTLTDTLRWMTAALTIFVALNVLVDGYFYLTILLLLLMYTCAVTGIWPQSEMAELQDPSGA